MTQDSETLSLKKNFFGNPVPWILVGMAVVVLSTGFKIIWNAYDEWNRAETLAATDPDQAMEHYERVIHWHVPFLSLSGDAAGMGPCAYTSLP